ncbi:4-hydroxyphenylpyruvate dioxygenase [Coemansia reversa NRRL 1564]|uniref:4-hydroxyphenylpyruvate dioxygenase n=1 Tax=Coemansia reversa (strain ATCC 12441 / NRRL 1564) TaxID=763665 RepID=A0A2G5BFN7_COERN|nr:4-hydroxyphenylpyruvate dioxygenase [Coemansia reversa NRRL 1564]|eukprot:PIA17836.1 4-hydroxyphenylpyruvate dioxygenase [Coemansia reversa NRRL 1564]
MTSYADKGIKPDVNYEAFHHITFWVGNAKQAAVYYIVNFGFRYIGYQGLETGHRDVVSHVVGCGELVFVFQSALRPGNKEMTEFLGLHGDGVKNVAFTVDNARECYRMAVEQGAVSVNKPWVESDDEGEVIMATIRVYGDTDHTFVERNKYTGKFLPGFLIETSRFEMLGDTLAPVPLEFIDHCVSNQPESQMVEVTERYEKMLGFHRFWSVDDKDISTEYSSLRSIVMAEWNEKVKMPINEPAKGLRKSQIDEYIEFYGGPGIQHIAIRTNDIIAAVTNMKKRGAQFLPAPKAYYDSLRERLQHSKITVTEDMDALEELNILVDFDDQGYLLQIFTMPLEDRPTVFLEFIQRHNHQGFGAGNFSQLFKAIEHEQSLRGNL